MNSCLPYLIIISILWSISPIFYKKAGIHYKNKNKTSAVKFLISGFAIGSIGTLLFVLSTTKCKNLTKNITYTYAIPIILSTVLSKLIYKEEISMKKGIGIGLIISGLYLV